MAVSSVLSRSQTLTNRMASLRLRLESGQFFQLREIKALRAENERLLEDWRLLRDDISEDTFFSVLEVLIDSLNAINHVYLEAITRGRGRTFRESITFRDEGAQRDYGFTPLAPNPIRPDATPYDDSQGSRVVDYRYRSSYRYTIRGGDTLQSIAKSQTGSEDNWQAIAQANGLTRVSELVSGQEIVIPALTATGGEVSEIDEFIISEVPNQRFSPGLNLELGTDFMVDPEKGIIPDADGHVRTVSGVDNVRQALNHRLQTKLGSLIQHSDSYGLNAVVGIPGIGVSSGYIQMSVINTLIHDPRVERVLNVDVDTQGDQLNVEATITLIRGAGETVLRSAIGT